MSARFDGSANQHVDLTAGGVGAAGTGAHTLAVLWYQTPTGFTNRMAVGLYASATLGRELMNVDGPLFGAGDFSVGVPGITTGTWWVAAITKPAGAAHYRLHMWNYNSAGTGTMSHGEATNAANHSDGSAITTIQVGKGDVVTSADIAVVGIWNSVLSDAQLDTLKAANLAAWKALNPAALVSLQNWNGTTGATDVAGTSTQNGLTGTVGVGAEPPSFDYTLTGGSVAATLSGKTPVLIGTASATQSNPATLSGKAPVVSGSVTATVANPVTLSGSLPLLAGSVPATEAGVADLSGSLPVLTGGMSAGQSNPVTLSGVLPLLTGAVPVWEVGVAEIAGSLPLLSGQLLVAARNQASMSGRLPLLAGRFAEQPAPAGGVDVTLAAGPTRFATLTADGTRMLYPLTAGPTRADGVACGDTRVARLTAADTRLQRGPR